MDCRGLIVFKISRYFYKLCLLISGFNVSEFLVFAPRKKNLIRNFNKEKSCIHDEVKLFFNFFFPVASEQLQRPRLSSSFKLLLICKYPVHGHRLKSCSLYKTRQSSLFIPASLKTTTKPYAKLLQQLFSKCFNETLSD